MHNIIKDPIVTLRCEGETISASLPQTLALLSEDTVVDFPALRPHQGPAWHAFLVQIAFLASEGADVPSDASGWAAALRGLTRPWPRDEPWCLVAPEEMPAFLQPAVSGSGTYGKDIATPDMLDTLVTAKNHDAKAARMRAATPEDWLFALVNLQTTEGYSGRGNYGIMRMNGGYASRPFLGIAPMGGPGARFRRDLAVLRRSREALFARAQGFARQRAIRLLWLEPWDGTESLPISDLHPLVIEICRRVRLVASSGGALAGRAAPSAAPRVAAEDLRGVTGDPWAPVETTRDGEKVLSINADGFGWRRMMDLIVPRFDTERVFERPLLAHTVVEDGEAAEIVAAALARGKGGTEGFHLRRIPLPNRLAIRALAGDAEDAEERRRLARLGEDFAAHAMTASNRCLRPALSMLLQKGPETIAIDRRSTVDQVSQWMRRFDHLIDKGLFERLWSGVESDAAARRALEGWDMFLHQAAFRVFDLAVEAAPCSNQRRIFAAVRARDLLRGTLRKFLPLSAMTPVQEPAHVE